MNAKIEIKAFPLMASRSGCSDGVVRGDLSPGPFPTRKGEQSSFDGFSLWLL